MVQTMKKIFRVSKDYLLQLLIKRTHEPIKHRNPCGQLLGEGCEGRPLIKTTKYELHKTAEIFNHDVLEIKY